MHNRVSIESDSLY